MTSIQPKIVYSPDYDIRFMGLEKLHPFDSQKYSRAWNLLHQTWGKRLEAITQAPPRKVTDNELLMVHTSEYLTMIKAPRYVAQAVELPFVALFPRFLINRQLLSPMRLATMGTLMAAEEAMRGGIAVNMSGGYHHASAEQGEGFCVFSDVALAIVHLRGKGLLGPGDNALIIDLDVHQGNGHERIFMDDPNVMILDMYNRGIYPADEFARRAITADIPLDSGIQDEQYLSTVKSRFPEFLDNVGPIHFAIYVAGTDIYEKDKLGMLRVSEEGILERDRFVFDLLVDRGIPFVMTLGGGYSSESYRFVANAIDYLLKTWGNYAT